MKKLHKWLAYVLLLLIAVVTLGACSKNEDALNRPLKEGDLEGTAWMATAYYPIKKGNTYELYATDPIYTSFSSREWAQETKPNKTTTRTYKAYPR